MAMGFNPSLFLFYGGYNLFKVDVIKALVFFLPHVICPVYNNRVLPCAFFWYHQLIPKPVAAR